MFWLDSALGCVAYEAHAAFDRLRFLSAECEVLHTGQSLPCYEGVARRSYSRDHSHSPLWRNLVDKATPKEQPKVSTDPTIKSDKKKDSELAENELNQVIGGLPAGGWNRVRNNQ
jgi:bacteriocin-like protein